MTAVMLRVMGTFGVTVDGQTLEDGQLGSRKARQLLELLVVERRRSVSTDRIAEVLWGGQTPQRPADNVATLVSRLRRVLGSAVICGGRGGYALADIAEVSVDVVEAERLATEAQACLDRAPALPFSAATRAPTCSVAGACSRTNRTRNGLNRPVSTLDGCCDAPGCWPARPLSGPEIRPALPSSPSSRCWPIPWTRPPAGS